MCSSDLKIVSEKCNLVNIDTGATYRCVDLMALRNNCTNDKNKIIEISKNIDVEFTKDCKVFMNGEAVTQQIRSIEVTSIVSPISSIIEVRENMVNLQRKMAGETDVVLEGRDITTVVLPNAQYKFYIDAPIDERARKRHEQKKRKNIKDRKSTRLNYRYI